MNNQNQLEQTQGDGMGGGQTQGLPEAPDQKTQGGGMSLGNSSPIVNFNTPNYPTPVMDDDPTHNPENIRPTEPKEPETPKELTPNTPKTQADYEKELKEAQLIKDHISELLELARSGLATGNNKYFPILNQLKSILTEAEYKELSEMYYKYNVFDIKGSQSNLINKLNELNNKYTNIQYEIRSGGLYDNRTDEQMREDTDVQRTVKDTLAAGINPKTVSIGAGGGGGGGMSRNDEEEERKRRKKKEKELKQERQMQLILDAVNTVASGTMRGMGLGIQSRIADTFESNAENKVNPKLAQEKSQYDNSPKWARDYFDKLEADEKKR